MKKLIAIIGTFMIVIAFFRVINGAGMISVSNVLIYLKENEIASIDIGIYDQLKGFESLSGGFSWSDDLNFMQNIRGAIMFAFSAIQVFVQFIVGISTVFIVNIFTSAVAVLKLIWYLFGFGG